MVWTGQTFTVGQVLTANQMNNLQNDITALANADSGAPPIVNAALSGLPWVRANLTTSTVSLSGNVTAGSGVDISMNAYAFFPMIHCAGAAGTNALRVQGHTTDGASADNPRFRIFNVDSSNDGNYDVDYRYISA